MKIYLSSPINEKRSCDLVILAVENRSVKWTNFDNVIESFTERIVLRVASQKKKILVSKYLCCVRSCWSVVFTNGFYIGFYYAQHRILLVIR